MSVPYTRAPHQGGPGFSGSDTPHAALLIDFDNVTMGMRSDLSKELKSLLDTDVIKGKVSVQRAYADWRRYPQYIVPLSEASVDLIFAPAYGSNKKNATDIRMAIDAVELVFIRPEIGTYILLTGDSDFSSLVLKLKEYGKYVIGVGIQESSSDILVQNCDEYYSYTSLTGLTKTTELHKAARDPWVLVAEALKKMVARGDVMRSDRLKQVMQELDTNFDEGGMGFSKFSKFLTEASSRGLLNLKKLENGQYEVGPMRGGGRGRGAAPSSDSRTRRGGSRGRPDKKDREVPDDSRAAPETSESGSDPLQEAYALLRGALEDLSAAGRASVRDSDVKRKILQKHRAFDETELGFPKFSRFLAQAAEHGVVEVERTDRGNFEVRLVSSAPEGAVETDGASDPGSPATEQGAAGTEAESESASKPESELATDPFPEPGSDGPRVVEVLPSDLADTGLRLGPRRGSTRRRGAEDQPLFFEGQAMSAASTSRDEPQPTATSPSTESVAEPGVQSDGPSGAPSGAEVDIGSLGLPSDPEAIVRYLTHRYKGVGDKTAETLVDRFGADLFTTLRDDPDSISGTVPRSRAEQVIEAWRADYARRTSGAPSGGSSSGSKGGRGGRRGGRGRAPRGQN